MPAVTRTTIQCPRCGTTYDAMVYSIIDPGQDPEAKPRLLSGRINAAPCPRCGTVNALTTPLVYHDAAKELLISFVPPELNLSKDRQERVIGDLIREVTNSLPQEGRKGYLFQPRSALTMQGLIEQVLQADGVTPEMLEAQRAKMRLVEIFVQAQDEDALNALIREHDADIDETFLQMLTVMAQQMVQEGRPDVAQHILDIQGRVVEGSTLGQQLIAQNEQQEETVRQVADDIRDLGPQAQRSDFRDLAIRYADDPEKVQALVGLVRPAFDYQFFQELTEHIGKAPAADRDRLDALREHMLQLTEAVDQQTQMAVQESAQILEAILNSTDPDEMIRQNVALLDDTFMAVLSANIQQAEQMKDIQASARLKAIYEQVVAALRETMRPELRYINELLAAPTEDDARALLAEQGKTYGPELLEMIDAVETILASRGDQAMLDRLNFLRDETRQMLG